MPCLNSFYPQGNGQMGFARAGWPLQKELTVSEFALTSLIAERVQSEGQVAHLHFLGVSRGLSPPSMWP